MGKLENDCLPREKAIKYGFSFLEDYELLAIIIRTGNKNENVLELSKRILEQFNGLNYLKNASYNDLMNVKGLKNAKVLTLLTIFELSKRMNEKKDDFINNNVEAFNFIYPLFDSLDQECFYCLILNSRNKVLGIRLISKGGLNFNVIDCSDIIRECIKVNGRKIYLFHNHPSGSYLPSEADVLATKDIKRKCLLFHIKLVDHLVIANNNFCSIFDVIEDRKEEEIY